MIPDAQRIAIAKACGWKIGGDYASTNESPLGDRNATVHDLFEGVPYYLTDLNAMHEAEKSLPLDVFMAYGEKLADVLNLHTEVHGTLEAWRLHATAAQRAEAFLRTLNLWEGTP